ncbi:MAG: hypothetical protein NC347_07090 [Clostridium sp.]|nr:hypothetical protein [Clostridium sp.]MCX4351706.1 hypothetical protein [Lachnospiraceae bacterium]
MYTLIQNNMASMMELNEYYTLDEALKLYALMSMRIDIENGMMEEIKNK